MAHEFFTTWKSVLEKIEDAIAVYAASGKYTQQSYTNPDGVSVAYKNFTELLRDRDRIKSLAAAETLNYGSHRPIYLRKNS